MADTIRFGSLLPGRRHGQVVRQRIANPLPPVRIWVPPLLVVSPQKRPFRIPLSNLRALASFAIVPVKRFVGLAILLAASLSMAAGPAAACEKHLHGHQTSSDTSADSAPKK